MFSTNNCGTCRPKAAKSSLILAVMKFAELVVIARQIERGNLALAERVGEARDDHVAKLLADRVETELRVGANDLLQECRWLGDLDPERAERAKTNRPEFRIAQHDRIFGPPLLAGERLERDVINFDLEWAFEAVLPAFERRKDRQVARVEREGARRQEQIGELAFIDQRRRLAFADDELGAVFDFVFVPREPPDHRVFGVVEPLNDVDQFAAKFVPDAHGLFFSIV